MIGFLCGKKKRKGKAEIRKAEKQGKAEKRRSGKAERQRSSNVHIERKQAEKVADQ